jgi:hypothetical protein
MSIVRSQQSVDFEQLWRELPRAGLIPDRQAFKPRSAKAFLRHLIMLQAPVDDATLRVRLVGDSIRQQIGRDIVGQDFFEFMGLERRSVALEIVRAMFERPSGVWWVAPVHYERGFSQYWEMTAFPLAGHERNAPAVLGLIRPVDALLDSRLTDQKAIRVDLAVQFAFLEIGR